jgi:hypothetical protein
MGAVLAWHFDVGTLRDGRPIPAVGETLRHEGPLVMCRTGLHASPRLRDALTYARGPFLSRVRCEGEIEEQNDMLVCTERTILWRRDVTAELRLFARQCALGVAHLWDMPKLVRQYLETGDEKLRVAAETEACRAARRAAGAAIKATVQSAPDIMTGIATWNAAWTTAQATQAAAWATLDVVWTAAANTAGDAAQATGWAPGLVAQNERLTALVGG